MTTSKAYRSAILDPAVARHDRGPHSCPTKFEAANGNNPLDGLVPADGGRTGGGGGALPNASLHVHQPLGGFQGQASDILIYAEEMLKTKRRIIRLYAEHCRRSFEEVEQTLDRDHFMTPEEALEWGLIDRILKQREDVR
jgi:hypothetical protein